MNKLKLKKLNAEILDNHREITGFYSEYAKSAGLTLAGLIVLDILSKEAECTQSYIVKKTVLPKQTVNAIIKSFEGQGFVSLSDTITSDRRNKAVKLTEDGKKYAKKIISKIEEAQYRALDILGEEKAQMLVNTFVTYKENLKII